MREDTKLVYLGRENAKKNRTISSPMTLTSTSVFPTYKEYVYGDYQDATFEENVDPYILLYGREGSEITNELAKMLAELEGADYSIITGTGGSAVATAMIAFVSAGDHMIVTESCYAVANNVSSKFLKRFGVKRTVVNARIGEEIEEYIKPNTRVIYFESPASKTFEIQDIEVICKIAKKHNIVTIFDNTWGAPSLFKPMEYGIDVSVQSLSKYVDGHSDNLLGAISMKKEHFKTLYANTRYLTPAASHFNIYMALRGIRTAQVRLEKHFKTGMKVAKWLQTRPEVLEVLYPPLKTSPDHKRWKKYFKGAHGLMGFVLDKEYSTKQISQMIDKLKYFALGYSWGCYNSVVTVGNLEGKSNFTQYGRNTFIRIHCGLENLDDLIKDLGDGLDRLKD
ncbi:trans-sulfuration enzyme family protein [Pseudomonadota bacterium]